jgi:deoxyribodipyrimidine photo-lyase
MLKGLSAMLDISSFFERNERVTVYTAGECDPQGKCVLYWMQHAQRGRENEALNAAIALGNALDLPVVTLFVLTAYPSANLRHYTFMLEGIAEAACVLRERGTPLVMRVGSPPGEVLRLAREVKAAAIISDESDMRAPREWRNEVREQSPLPFACVDADVVVPSKFFPKEEWAARTLRPKLQRILPTYLQPIVDLDVKHGLEKPPCEAGMVDDPLAYLERLAIARSIKPSEAYHGGQSEGKRLLRRFITERMTGYAERRNHPELAGTSELSAYLHFGQLAAQQVAWEVEQVSFPLTGSALADAGGGRAAYLEELIARRELAVNFALRNPRYDTLEGCPAWALATLQKHAGDPRPQLYTLEELEEASTHDDLWNACQREMVITGRMHAYMRMYWAKKILEWVADPAEAFSHAVYLNDKYELDGRDANGYTGIAWAIGGKHDRPWGPERPIFGLVRYMSLGGMQRKFDTEAYIQIIARLR